MINNNETVLLDVILPSNHFRSFAVAVSQEETPTNRTLHILMSLLLHFVWQTQESEKNVPFMLTYTLNYKQEEQGKHIGIFY